MAKGVLPTAHPYDTARRGVAPRNRSMQPAPRVPEGAGQRKWPRTDRRGKDARVTLKQLIILTVGCDCGARNLEGTCNVHARWQLHVLPAWRRRCAPVHAPRGTPTADRAQLQGHLQGRKKLRGRRDFAGRDAEGKGARDQWGDGARGERARTRARASDDTGSARGTHTCNENQSAKGKRSGNSSCKDKDKGNGKG